MAMYLLELSVNCKLVFYLVEIFLLIPGLFAGLQWSHSRISEQTGSYYGQHVRHVSSQGKSKKRFNFNMCSFLTLSAILLRSSAIFWNCVVLNLHFDDAIITNDKNNCVSFPSWIWVCVCEVKFIYSDIHS